MGMPHVDQATLRRLLIYCPHSGLFLWRSRSDVGRAWNTRYSGKVAGYDWTVGPHTYRSIRIFDWPFLGHRLAVLYMTGEWPAEVVDHADGDGTNNKWSNLRLATRAQNMANSGAFSSNNLGLRGVCIHPPSGKFRATIKVQGKKKHLGHFDTAEEAHATYLAEARRVHGEFVRSQ